MMIKKLAIVSLSAGVLGEDFIKHELEIGLKKADRPWPRGELYAQCAQGN